MAQARSWNMAKFMCDVGRLWKEGSGSEYFQSPCQ
jgi:hypothetical protein